MRTVYSRLFLWLALIAALAGCNLPAGGADDPSTATDTVGGTMTSTLTSTLTGTPTLTITTPTFTVTSTRTATVTGTVTGTATRSLTPSPTSPVGFALKAAPEVFYVGRCTPDVVEISVVLTTSKPPAYVYLFYLLQNQAAEGVTAWSEPLVMSRAAGRFSLNLPSAKMAGAETFVTSWLLVQFVTTDNLGGIIERSDVYPAATLARCGVHLIPRSTPNLRLIRTPTRPPIIK